MRQLILSTLVVAGLAGCSSTTGADLALQNAAAGLRVTVEKTSYTRDDVITGRGGGIRGKIINDSDRTVYARLGDAFNAAVEQDPVYIAGGSDGALERSSGASWSPTEIAILVEGVREIELRAGREYTFIAPAGLTTQAGTYRIRVAFRSTSGAAPSGEAVSPSFEIR